ncbi:NAD-dependent epimerase/dehydratase family protein [Devosia ginsengisoli]|uniref:NAD-dependent epimerase/dehydratase family protein n=1 Tax=Devosia ginsengisoli TaxID=400770 RepID=UPI0034E95E97
MDAHVFDGSAPGATLGPSLRRASHVVFSIAPGADGDPALLHHRADLDAAENLQWLCYYSTVGVYGDFGGDWIDEAAPLVPRNERSDRRVLAEQAWRDYARARSVPLAILRLAGIYGPGRSTFDKLADGTARRVIKPGQVFNRIHVEDIGRVTALAAQARLEGTFNLADDEPAPPQDLVAHAAGLMGVEPPPEVPYDMAEFTPMQRSFYADNKRVSNAAIKRALGIELLYPTYREGLAAIHEIETP